MFDEQFPEDDEHAECRHEIQTLSAELERVKAERDEWQKTHEDHVWETIEHIDEMKKDRQSAIDQLIKAKGILKGLKHKAKTLSRERDVARLETKQLKSEVASSLEKMICTEGEDAGVFFLSPESESKYDPKLNCHVYRHEHFSELGDALIGLWKIVSRESSQE